MEQCVNEQMATRKHAEEPAVDHMCDPREWMPISVIKSRECPGESIEGHTAIHHRVFRDIRRVIEIDEAMPDHLRINPKCYYRQTEQDEKIASLECCNVADLECSLLAKTFGVRSSSVGCGKADSLSLFRGPLIHAVCETIR